MTDKTLKIIKKLPTDLQKEFETDFALHPKNSNKFNEWAKDVIYKLDIAREENYINMDEWNIIYDDLFEGWISGKIGENAEIKHWDRFWEALNYEGEE